MSNTKKIYVGQRYSNLENKLTTLASFCTTLSTKVQLEINLQHYSLTREEYQTKAIKDLKLYYEQENITRRQNAQYINLPQALPTTFPQTTIYSSP